MIKISVFEKDNVISEIIIIGHAQYDTKGKDIVCASVSSIVITCINNILVINDKAIKYDNKDGYIKINNIIKDDITNKLLVNMVNLLEELTSDYPKNINMKRG